MSVGSRGSLRVSNQDDWVCTVQSVLTSFAACVPAVRFRVHYPAVRFRVHYPAVLLPVSGKPPLKSHHWWHVSLWCGKRIGKRGHFCRVFLPRGQIITFLYPSAPQHCHAPIKSSLCGAGALKGSCLPTHSPPNVHLSSSTC